MLSQAQVSHRLKIAQKIPLLNGLSGDQVNRVLQSGKVRSVDAENTLCESGDNSSAMWILMSGELRIRQDKIVLAVVEPVEIVGEMGLITGLPRSATIRAEKDVVVLEIAKLRLESLLRKDIDLERKLYRNMLKSLCGKLRQNNAQLTESGSERSLEIAASVT